jgi:hypothetical protein
MSVFDKAGVVREAYVDGKENQIDKKGRSLVNARRKARPVDEASCD